MTDLVSSRQTFCQGRVVTLLSSTHCDCICCHSTSSVTPVYDSDMSIRGTCMACRTENREVILFVVMRKAFRYCAGDTACRRVVNRMANTHRNLLAKPKRLQALTPDEVERRHRSKTDRSHLLKHVLKKQYTAAVASASDDSVVPSSSNTETAAAHQQPATERKTVE